ncbi:MAG TPA: lipopolysaccharide biosynthesis protein [Caldilineaceae bacterium]|nr:lipopolysaccharide biosynthesis protein [Caldilineaceae bacterium]
MTLRQRVFGGFVWLTVSSLLVQLITFGTSVALARLLTPADFALLAIAMIFVSLSTILSEFGFGQALIQWPGEVEGAVQTAFVINTVISLAFAAVLYLAAPMIATYYAAPPVTWVVRAMSLNLLLTGISIVPGSLLERRMHFRARARGEIWGQVAYALVSVPLAWWGVGVWSLVAGILVSTGLRSAIFWRAAAVRVALHLDRQAAGRLLRFGRHLVLISLMLFAINRLDIFYLGKVTTLAEVGYYGLALSTVNLTVDLVTSVLARVTFPAFSQLQQDWGQIGRVYLRAMRLTGYITLPMILGLMAVAPAGIIGLYGEQWEPAVALTRILCVFALFRTLGRLVGNIFTATGRPGVTTQLAAVRLVILVTLMVGLGALWQTPGVAWAVSLSMALSGGWSLWLTNRYLGISHRRFWSAIRPQLMAATGMGILVAWIASYLPHSLPALAALVLAGIACYAVLLWLLDRAGIQREIHDLWLLVCERIRPNLTV